jgi:hypothetical protein
LQCCATGLEDGVSREVRNDAAPRTSAILTRGGDRPLQTADPVADDETIEININRTDLGYDPYQSGRVKKPRVARS